MEKGRGILYTMAGAVFLVVFLIISFFYLKTVTGQVSGGGSALYVQGMPLVLLTLLFLAGWFMVVKRKSNQ